MTTSIILDNILPVHETSDMTLVTRLREIILKNMTVEARQILNEFPLWYDPVKTAQKGQVFWSENHYIMTASSDLLLRELLDEPISDSLLGRVSTFLDVKIEFGTSEWLSPVYLPFTITSLLNLYDFTSYQDIKDKCQILVDRIATEVLAVTSPYDGSIVSPSGRAYARHRKATRGLHLNLFIDFLMSGTNLPRLPQDPEMALRECLKDTTYRPSPSVFSYFRNEKMDTYIRLSSRWVDLSEYLEKKNVPNDVYVSIIWGYGLYIPQQYKAVQRVVSFMDTYNMWNHYHFKALASTRKSMCWLAQNGISRIFYGVANTWIASNFVKGAMLTGASMYVHKEGKVVMSSLLGYNSGLPSFQQWPFAVNLSGVPIWCGFGSIGTGILSKFGNKEAGQEMSTAKLFPTIHQSENYLVATYKSSSYALGLTTIGLKPQMHWPIDKFDAHGSHGKWTWAMKSTAVIAYKINGRKVEIYVKDLHLSNTALDEFLGHLN